MGGLLLYGSFFLEFSSRSRHTKYVMVAQTPLQKNDLPAIGEFFHIIWKLFTKTNELNILFLSTKTRFKCLITKKTIKLPIVQILKTWIEILKTFNFEGILEGILPSHSECIYDRRRTHVLGGGVPKHDLVTSLCDILKIIEVLPYPGLKEHGLRILAHLPLSTRCCLPPCKVQPSGYLCLLQNYNPLLRRDMFKMSSVTIAFVLLLLGLVAASQASE